MVCHVRDTNLVNPLGLATNGHEEGLSCNRRTALCIYSFVFTLSYQFSNYIQGWNGTRLTKEKRPITRVSRQAGRPANFERYAFNEL